MGFMKNLIEDMEGYLVRTMGDKKFKEIEEREKESLLLQSSLNYRRTDMVFLVKEGFEYKKHSDTWEKKEDIKQPLLLDVFRRGENSFTV